ncbi:DciA family protein [Streptomyces vietnamensis]|uniref:DciA family protein n=1 Tax=Streptomyces vietnamensis TaxID=362257 RepID=UPI0007C71460|nr:DciA family protein [Streptomyces vietnamensis]
MSPIPETSGVDLTRQALLAALEAAKARKTETRQKPKRRTTTLVRDGCAPLALGTAIGMMMTVRGLVAPADGGSVLVQWEIILTAAAPELAGHVKAVAYDGGSGRLDVVPDAPAYGTKVRWIAPKLIEAVNKAVPNVNVQTVRVLALTSRAATTATSSAAADEPAPRPVVLAGPVKTRESASAGCHRAVVPPHQEDPALAAAVVRQEQARRDLADRVFSDIEQDQESEASASLGKIRAQQRQAAEAVRAAAIQGARVERAAGRNSAGRVGTETARPRVA